MTDLCASATAFFARAGKKPQRGDKRDKRERRDKFDPSKHCDFCEIDGHDVLVCRKAKRALEESKAGKKGTKSKPKNKKASASIAVADEEEESDSDNETVYSTTDTAVAMVSVTDHSTIGNQWILDSGASRNMCSNRDWFFQFTPLSSPVNVVLADDHAIQGTGVGHITVQARAGGKWHRAILQDVLYVPELRGNLLSVQQLVDRGISIQFTKKGCKLLNPQGAVFCETFKRGNLYPMPIRVLMPESARMAMVQLEEFPSEGDAAPHTDIALVVSDVTSRADAHTWHRRLGHLHDSAVLRMVKKGMVQGMEITGGGASTVNCEPCIKGKQTRAEILKETKLRADTVLGRVFSDVCGKLTTRSIEGFEYFVTFIDDKSRKVFVQGLKKKSEVS